MSGRSLIEFILYVLEYVGIKKEYVSVMLNNSVKVDNSQVISWDYFLMEFDQDLKQILQYAYSSFPFDDQQIEYLSTYKKSKRYLCYNANLHAHRLFILNCIFIKKLEGFGLISALNRGEDSLEALQHYYDDHMFDCLETYYSLESVRESDHPLNPVYSFIPTLFDKLPLILDIDNEYLLKENFDIISKMKETYPNLPLEIDNRKFSFRTDRYIHTEHFTDTYFSLVTETTVEHYKWGIDNVVRLTEKIYKAVALHPFIVIGNKNTLKYLRSIGFETFPEMFDESYDDIDDPIDRMIFIMEEVERLCFMDIEELHKIYVSVLPKIKHNQEVLMNMNFKEMFYKKLEENLDE